jgi:hypothetical protein
LLVWQRVAIGRPLFSTMGMLLASYIVNKEHETNNNNGYRIKDFLLLLFAWMTVISLFDILITRLL